MLPRKARDAAIVAAYQAQPDVSQRELCRALDVSRGVVERALARAGAVDPERHRAVQQRLHREGFYAEVKTGRKAVWPDCPPELLREYHNLRRKGVSSAEARRALDPGFQA